MNTPLEYNVDTIDRHKWYPVQTTKEQQILKVDF